MPAPQYDVHNDVNNDIADNNEAVPIGRLLVGATSFPLSNCVAGTSGTAEKLGISGSVEG